MGKAGKAGKAAVVLLTDKNYLFALGAFIINILDKLPWIDAIIVYYSGFEAQDRDRIKSLDERIRLIEYSLEDFKQEILSEDADLINNDKVSAILSRYSHFVLAKIKAFQLLDEYAHVACFDLDMLLLEDIGELFGKMEYNALWKWDYASLDAKIKFAGFNQDFEFDDYAEYGKMLCPNGGFFILNNNFDYFRAFELGKEFMRRCMKYHPTCIDELTLAYIAYKLGLKVLGLDEKIYNVFPYLFNTSSKLLHFLTDYKPWKSELIQFIYPQWRNYYLKFKRETGLGIKSVKFYDNIGNFLFRLDREESWLSVLRDSIFPPGLEISYQLRQNELVLKINSWQHFSISKRWLFNLFKIQLKFNAQSPFFDESFKSRFADFMQRHPACEFVQAKDYWLISLPSCAMWEILEKFYYLYNICNSLFDDGNAIPQPEKMRFGYLKTYFNKYFCLNGLQLRQTSDHNLADAILACQYEDKLAFRLKDTDSYIQSFFQGAFISLGKRIQFFECLDPERPAIKCGNRYLSALAGPAGKFALMPHCREWERFAFIESK